MTCPVSHISITDSAPAPISTDRESGGIFESAVRGNAVERFERVAGSVFVGLFATALFDQAMMPAVSAALEDTGRIRNTPWLRALRTAASDQIVFSGDDADRREESARLLHRNAAVVISGEDFTDADNQAIWNRFREMVADLQLPGRSRLIADYRELCSYYDSVVANQLEVTPTLQSATNSVLRPPHPDFIPVVAAPLWGLVAPFAGQVAAVLGFGVMHPDVQALVPMNWTRRHDLEFRALSFLVRSAYRILPTALTDTPLTRNRRKYEQLMTKYKGIGLTSFAPDHRTVAAPTASTASDI